MASIVLDTNILSIFAELDQLEFLTTVLRKHELVVTPAIYQEISTGIKRGHKHLQPVLDLVGEGKTIDIVSIPSDEKKQLATLPSTLGQGEAESIVVCLSRGWIFSSFDRKAVKFCRQNGVAVITLNDILAAAWKGKFTTKRKVRAIIRQIEATGRTLKAKDEILK